MEAVNVAADSVSDTNESEQWFRGMTWSERIQGYLIFMSLGLFASMMSWFAMGMGSYWKYTVLATMGSIMSLCSTIMLMGPVAQLRYMFDEYRAGATTLYLLSLVLSLVVAVWTKSAMLCVIVGLFQYATLFWYSLSYIPYGRETVWGYVFG